MRLLRTGTAPSARDRDEGFALIQVMLFSLMVTGVSLVLLLQLAAEVRQTSFARRHEQSLGTAMAGLNAGLARLRGAVDPATGAGVLTYLPCTAGSTHTTITGRLDQAGVNVWSTDIYYLDTDPATLSVTQLDAAALACPLGTPPAYAQLVSHGRNATFTSTTGGARGDRTVRATYRFTTTNANATGGQVAYGGTCWDAGASPAVGSAVTFQPCLATGTPSQSWSYRADLSLQWAGDPSRNLCLDYAGNTPSTTVHYVALQTCLGSGNPGTAYNSLTGSYPVPAQQYQEFSTNATWNDVAANGDRSTGCVTSYDAASGSWSVGAAGHRLVVAPSAYCYGAAWASASAGVGAGEASGVSSGLPGPTQQLVSLANFSRCLDVNSSNPSYGLISWPCHQAPDQLKIEGNQQFQYSGTTATPGTLTTTRPGFYGTVCFDYGGTTATLVTCVPGAASQQWQLTGAIVGDYADSYTIRDNRGLCLQSNTPSGTLGSIVLATCTGADNQKWNAPPGAVPSQLRALGEQ